MLTSIIMGGKLILPHGIIPNQELVISNGKIANIQTQNKDSLKMKKSASQRIMENEHTIIDATNLYIAPGFIDLHVHGGYGWDTSMGTTTALQNIALYHTQGGTTSLLPTLMAAPPLMTEKFLQSVSRLTGKKTGGATILGAHLEGPYLNPLKAGAQNPAFLHHPDVKEMQRFISLAKDSLKIVTLAPELPGSKELMALLKHHDIVIAIGHSLATYDQTVEAFQEGLCHAVHLFNALAPFHHRQPGVIGAVLTHPGISIEMIADNHHLHHSVLQLLGNIKKEENLILVTDAIAAAGLPPGIYSLAGQTISLHNGCCQLPNHTLAGSNLTMIQAIRNMVYLAHVPLEQAVLLATRHPAKRLGLASHKGSIAPHMDADLVFLDQNLQVTMTMVMGEMVYQQAPFP